jgi:DNA-3-methyladenine glycosylase II
VGRWTAEYVLLRGLGRVRVFPGDDVGARNNLRRWLRLRRTLDYEGVRRVLARWSGHAGLVYFHLLLDRLADAGYLGEKGSEAQDTSGYRKQADAEA